MPKKIDLTGQKFGRLTVLYRNGSNKKGLVIWHCKCDCGNECDKLGIRLVKGVCKSCGCYRKDYARENHIKTNKYDLTNSYGIGYDCNNKEFYFDLCNYEIIKNYCWRVRNDGYVDAKIRDGSGKRILMHVLLFGENCDHIGGCDSRSDNRIKNIRKFDNCEYSFETYNNMNKKIQTNNKSGITGVSWHKRDESWYSYISINNKRIHLGKYKNLEDAIKARKEAEEKFFGECSYDNSQKIASNF